MKTAGFFALAGFAVWYWFNPTSNDPLLTITTIALFALGIVPTLLWVGRGEQSYPILEILLLTAVPFYALPILTEHDTIGQYPIDLLQKAALAVVAFLLAAVIGGGIVKRFYRPSRRRMFWQDEIIPEGKLHFTAHAVTPALLFGSVSGEVVVEGERQIARSDRQFSMTLSDAQYAAVLAVVERWRTAAQPSYNLDRRNCVHFVADVAEALGLSVDRPRGMMKRPRSFLQHVRSLNPQLAAAPVGAAAAVQAR